MDITPSEAEEALAAIQKVAEKTRRAISKSGAMFLIVWGIVWLFGFLTSHFVGGDLAGYIWMGLDILGGLASAVIGARMNQQVRSPSASASGKRIAWFWLLLFLYCAAAIGLAWPADSKQLAMFIILFVMVGWMAMGLLLSFASYRLGISNHRPFTDRVLRLSWIILLLDGGPWRWRDDHFGFLYSQ